MTNPRSIQDILQSVIDNNCNPAALGNLELAIAWKLLGNERLRRQGVTEPMQCVLNR